MQNGWRDEKAAGAGDTKGQKEGLQGAKRERGMDEYYSRPWVWWMGVMKGV